MSFNFLIHIERIGGSDSGKFRISCNFFYEIDVRYMFFDQRISLYQLIFHNNLIVNNFPCPSHMIKNLSHLALPF